MQNNFIDNIATSVKILIIFILILMLIFAKSIYLILFLSLLVIIILFLANLNVKVYIDTLKNNSNWLLFFSLAYIIIFGKVFSLLIILLKLILTILVIKTFVGKLSFNKLNDGLYTILCLFKIKNAEEISYKISILVFYIVYYFGTKSKIKNLRKLCIHKGIYFKNNLLPRVLMASNDINKLEFELKLKFYTVKKDKINIISYLLLFIFITLFILTIFKEVVL